MKKKNSDLVSPSYYSMNVFKSVVVSYFLARTDIIPLALRHFSQLMLLGTKGIKCNITENSVMERQATKVSEICQVEAF